MKHSRLALLVFGKVLTTTKGIHAWRKTPSGIKLYVIDTNVLIHDPNAPLNFEEHRVIIPLTVLEELDKLKNGNTSLAADCRQSIRMINTLLGDASPQEIEAGVPIYRESTGQNLGTISILMDLEGTNPEQLPETLNDNKIINALVSLQSRQPDPVILVSKDINMRLKARACGVDAQDYHTDQLVDDIDLLPRAIPNSRDHSGIGSTRSTPSKL